MSTTVLHDIESRYPTPQRPDDSQNVVIYYDQAEFAGWPFNHGMWSFSDEEILVSFSRGPCSYHSLYDMQHDVVDARGGEYVVVRSMDGGRTWPIDTVQSLGSRLQLESDLVAPESQQMSAGVDWTSPDFCLTAGFGIPPSRARHIGYTQYSTDRGHSWNGPIKMPSFGFSWIQVKPDFLVRPDGLVLLFVTVGIGDGSAGTRFVAVYASPDQGESWNYLAPIQSTASDTSFVNRYYASPVLMPDGRILAALRCQIDGANAWPEIFESDDGGRSWRYISRPSDWGGPTHLTLLDDGRLLAVYGYRARPYGIRARVSEDDGRSWGPELILRDDAGSRDLGYPRTVKLSGGRVLTAYYFNRADDLVQCNGGVRHIAGTIFTP